MSNKDNKDKEKLAPVSLATMVGEGVFVAQGNEYTIKALKLRRAQELVADKMATAIPFFDFTSEESIKKLKKWFPLILFRDGKPVELEDILDEWDLLDLKRFWNQVIGISG